MAVGKPQIQGPDAEDIAARQVVEERIAARNAAALERDPNAVQFRNNETYSTHVAYPVEGNRSISAIKFETSELGGVTSHQMNINIGRTPTPNTMEALNQSAMAAGLAPGKINEHGIYTLTTRADGKPIVQSDFNRMTRAMADPVAFGNNERVAQLLTPQEGQTLLTHEINRTGSTSGLVDYTRTPSSSNPNVAYVDAKIDPSVSRTISEISEDGTMASRAAQGTVTHVTSTVTVTPGADANAIRDTLNQRGIQAEVRTSGADVLALDNRIDPKAREQFLASLRERNIQATLNQAGTELRFPSHTAAESAHKILEDAKIPSAIGGGPLRTSVVAQAPIGETAMALEGSHINPGAARDIAARSEAAHPGQMQINRDVEAYGRTRPQTVAETKPAPVTAAETPPATAPAPAEPAVARPTPNAEPRVPVTANENALGPNVQTLRPAAAAAPAAAAEQEAARVARAASTARAGATAARSGGHGVLGMAVVGVVTAGTVLASGGGVAHAAEAGGTAMAEGALPGVTTGFDNLQQGNFVDRMLNGANTATAGVATAATLVTVGAGAASLTGVAAPVAVPTAAVAGVVTAGATVANLAVGVVHDITYLAGMSEQGGLIMGPSDKPFVETQAMTDAKTAMAADKVNQDLINSPASARAAELMDSKTPLPDPKMEAMRQQLLQAERDIPNASPIGEMGQPFSPRQNAQLAYNSQLATFIHTVNGDAPPAPAVAPAPGPGQPTGEAVASATPQPNAQQPTASAAPPLPPGVTEEQAARARAALSNTTVTGGTSHDEAPPQQMAQNQPQKQQQQGGRA